MKDGVPLASYVSRGQLLSVLFGVRQSGGLASFVFYLETAHTSVAAC